MDIEPSQFFAPASTDLIDGLIGQYNQSKQRITEVSELVTSDHGSVISYFLEGNVKNDRGYVSLDNVFNLKGAVKALDADYWARALNLTDVFDYMPQKRRDEWHESLRAWKESGYKEGQNPNKDLPEFSEQIVRDTLMSLLSMRTQFLAEKVDGIFRGLSGEHVTNQPEGFGKRMIIAGVIGSFGYIEWRKSGLITDLRAIVAKFMGRDEPRHGASDGMLKALKNNYGQWVSIDGGAIRIRLYMKGTAHMEIHPDMAWRLNAILAHLYPMAIPESFRKKPNKKHKDFGLIQKPLPFSVIEGLADLECARENKPIGFRDNYVRIKDTAISKSYKPLSDHVKEVLKSIGGVELTIGKGYKYFQFDYDPYPVIDEIICSGCIPDYKSHQYYPTPDSIAQIAVNLAEIEYDDKVLEPSAGQGAIADKISAGLVTCVEISALHCKILEQKEHKVFQGDFLKWVDEEGKHLFFDKIIMNPPFSEGRWQAHLQAAASKLNVDGKLVAILPASAKGKDLIDGFKTEFHGPYSNEFENTGISVVIAVITK
jgi:Domain of unknown function (DUF4942)